MSVRNMVKFLVGLCTFASLVAVRAHNPCSTHHETPVIVYAQQQESSIVEEPHGYKGREIEHINTVQQESAVHQTVAATVVPERHFIQAPVIKLAHQLAAHQKLQEINPYPIYQHYQQYNQLQPLEQPAINRHGNLIYSHHTEAGVSHVPGNHERRILLAQPFQTHQVIGSHYNLHPIPHQLHSLNLLKQQYAVKEHTSDHSNNAHHSLGSGVSFPAHYGGASSHGQNNAAIFVDKSSYQPVNAQNIHLGQNHVEESEGHKSAFINGKYHIIRPDGSVFKHHPSYRFEYFVNDHKSGDIHRQKEEREGDVVTGEYSLVEPDGNVRTVKYSADWETGFHADVTNSKAKKI